MRQLLIKFHNNPACQIETESQSLKINIAQRALLDDLDIHIRVFSTIIQKVNKNGGQ
jgi:hypothetical protein